MLVRNKLFPNWQPRRLRETEFGCQSHFLPINISAPAHAARHYGGFASGKLDSSARAGVGLCWVLRPGLRTASSVARFGPTTPTHFRTLSGWFGVRPPDNSPA
jgi:hypothetical protein